MGERDYYADLELPPTADIPEIKKQFRKLGQSTSIMRLSTSLLTFIKLSSTTPIETLDEKPRSMPSSRKFSPPTKSLEIRSQKQNSMLRFPENRM